MNLAIYQLRVCLFFVSTTQCFKCSFSYYIQETFHVYLNKFKNAGTNLFLVIFGNNWFSWASLISRNTQPSRKQVLIIIFWFEIVSEDEQSNFKRLKMLYETKCTKSFSNNFSKLYEVFLLEPFIYCT